MIALSTSTQGAQTEMTTMLNRPSLTHRAACFLLPLACLVACLAWAPPALADFGIDQFDGAVSNADGSVYTQAGGHPDQATTAITLNKHENTALADQLGLPPGSTFAPDADAKNILVDLPPGFVGNPTLFPTCTGKQLVENGDVNAVPLCPVASQVGVIRVRTSIEPLGAFKAFVFPLYKMVPPPGVPARLGFLVTGIPVFLDAQVRSDAAHGLSVVAKNIPQALQVWGTEVTLWGVPADPSHDAQRCQYGGFGLPAPDYICDGKIILGGAGEVRSGPHHLDDAPVPFITNPTACPAPGQGLMTTARADAWTNPGAYDTASFESHLPPGYPADPSTWGPPQGTTGCANVPFAPSASLKPSSSDAHSPSGLDVHIDVPQPGLTNIGGIAPAHLKQVEFRLPEGMTINPASADGLAACTDAQLRFGLEGASQCPDAAKLGIIEVDTPLLEDPLPGSVYLRSQASSDPASGELYRLAIALRSEERGVTVKLPGQLRVDPDTGQLTTTFNDLPQLPFESMQLHLKSGPRAPLTTPINCGTYTTHAVLTGWSGAVSTLEPSFTIDENCAKAGFAPSFEAGVTDNFAGHYSPLKLRVTRGSGQPNLARIEASLPQGLLAKFAGVELCPESAMAAGGCPESSRVGDLVAGIGEGTSPLFLPQPGREAPGLYVGGPYQGAPYSVLAEVPAQAGPFDLGTVTVRNRIDVDPETTQVHVVSESLPQIYAGIPVTYRDLRIDVNRPNYVVNPTSCEPMATTGVLSSAAGDHARVSDRFQLADCALLPFEPRTRIFLRGSSARRGHPALRVVVTAGRSNEANVARAVTALPASLILDQSRIGAVCTRVQYASGPGGGVNCPPASIYGRVSATTPLLDYPLVGPVILRSSSHKLPDLVFSLRGPVQVDLAARIDSTKAGGLRATLENVPDAFVSRFVVEMKGGRKGLIQNSINLCSRRQRALVKYDAHNGKFHDTSPVVRADCGRRRARGGGAGGY